MQAGPIIKSHRKLPTNRFSLLEVEEIDTVDEDERITEVSTTDAAPCVERNSKMNDKKMNDKKKKNATWADWGMRTKTIRETIH